MYMIKFSSYSGTFTCRSSNTLQLSQIHSPSKSPQEERRSVVRTGQASIAVDVRHVSFVVEIIRITSFYGYRLASRSSSYHCRANSCTCRRQLHIALSYGWWSGYLRHFRVLSMAFRCLGSPSAKFRWIIPSSAASLAQIETNRAELKITEVWLGNSVLPPLSYFVFKNVF